MLNCKVCSEIHYWDDQCSESHLLEKEVSLLQKEVVEKDGKIALLEKLLGSGTDLMLKVVEEAQKFCTSLQTQGRGNSLALEAAVRAFDQQCKS